MRKSFAASLSLHFGFLFFFFAILHSTHSSNIGTSSTIRLYLPNESHLISQKNHLAQRIEEKIHATSASKSLSKEGFKNRLTLQHNSVPTTLITPGKINLLLIQIHNQIQATIDEESDSLPELSSKKTVTLQFRLNADGSLSDIHVIQSSEMPLLDEIATQAVQTVHLDGISFKIPPQLLLQIKVKF